ncbi:MAG: MFS transporter [Anaerolineales bacterium]|nr:MFS transporter [Anaerolineales bacterium]
MIKPPKYNFTRNQWLILLAMGVGTFMSALDGSVVNTILPVLQNHFQTDVATIEWVVTVYLLLVSGLLLSVGRLGDLRGNKNTYVAGFILFVLSSALCGLAPRPIFLIAGRGLQAFGAAMLFANSPAILTKNFPAIQRGQVLGLQGMMTYLGLTTGPFLGGWLAESFGWQAVFYINVPVGLLAILLSWFFIPEDKPVGESEPFDLWGAVSFMAGLIALLLGLNQGHHWGWGSGVVLGLLSASLLILGAFIWIEAHSKAPMLDLSLFRNRIFRTSSASPLLNYICVYSVLFLLPFYLIRGRGFSPSQTGLILTSQPLMMALTAPLAGAISDRIGSQKPTTLGMVILATGIFWLSRLGLQAPIAQIVPGLMLCGLGTGLFVAPNNSALMGAAPLNRQGIASGVLALSRTTGMVLGVGLTGAIFTTALASGGENDPATIVQAVKAGMVFAGGTALLAALITYSRGNDSPMKN